MFSAFAIPRIAGDRNDGIHLLWSAPSPSGYALDGFSIWRRSIFQAGIKDDCVEISTGDLFHLHRTFRRTTDGLRIDYKTIPIYSDSPKVGVLYRHRYEIALPSYCDSVRIECNDGQTVIGVRGGKAITREAFVGEFASLNQPGLEKVFVYSHRRLTKLTVCCRTVTDDDWSSATLIAEDIQIPFAPAHADVRSVEDAWRVAKSRLISGEALESGEFDRLFHSIGDALEVTDLPVERVTQKHGVTTSVIETQIFGQMLSLTLLPEWRRALGFGYFDPGRGLTENVQYDYKISGKFRSRDLRELRHDFTAIPVGTHLPLFFRTGEVRWFVQPKTKVVTLEPIADGKAVTILKGIKPTRLTVELSTATHHLHADLFGTASARFFRNGLVVDTQELNGTGRTLLRPSAPFDTVKLFGPFHIGSICENAPLDDHATETLDTYVRFVPYVDSPGPHPVQEVAVQNLQRAEVAQKEQNSAGFEIAFVPAGGIGWPNDLPYAPPFSESYSILLRDGLAYDGNRGIVVASRHRTVVEANNEFGIDLERRFVNSREPESYDPVVRVQDTLGPVIPPNTGRREIRYGDTFSFEIATVDAIGRQSAPLGAPPIRLEKWLPPPHPGGPITPTKGDPRSGVRAKYITRDQTLSERDAALLGRRENALILEWGWADYAADGPQTERDRDPFVTEFRVYFRAKNYTEVQGHVLSVRRMGQQFDIEVQLDEPVGEDSLINQPIELGYPFRIVSHGVGDRITLRIHGSHRGQTPRALPFTLGRSDRDGGGPPTSWDERVDVVPYVDAKTDYVSVLPGSLVEITPAGPVIRGYLGVSAADDQFYVPDTITTGRLGRHAGNESYVSMTPIVVEYIGRPYVEQGDIGDVEHLDLKRARGEGLIFRLQLSDWDPPAWTSESIRIQRCTATEFALRLKRASTGLYVNVDDSEIDQPLAVSAMDRAQIESDLAAGRLSDRYAAFVANAFNFDSLWKTVHTGPLGGALVDTLPNANNRWIYRVQLTDEKGRTSANYWTVPICVEVPKQYRPPTPVLSRLERTEVGAIVGVTIPARDVGASVLLFATSVEGPTERELDAKLVVVPNRDDLGPTRTHRVQTRNGDFIEPIALDPSDAAINEGDATWQIPVENPAGAELQIWAVAVRDGVVSTLAGPRRDRDIGVRDV